MTIPPETTIGNDGLVEMVTEPLDINDLLKEAQ